MTNANRTSAAPSRLAKILRWTLPFFVSTALLVYVFSGLDVSAVLDRFDARVALYFVPSLVVFLFISLWIEALCLVMVVRQVPRELVMMTAARIKAASYLLSLLNYALGIGAVTVLLRRRARMEISEAAGSILVISLFDLGSLLLMVTVGAVLIDTDTAGVQFGVVLGAVGTIVAGFAVLRAPISMGPLDRLRDLQVFRSARTLPLGLLAGLGALRFGFVGLYVLLTHLTLVAFGVSIPPLHLIVNVSIMLLISALPIAAAGLGTGQIVFVSLLDRWASSEALLATSLTLSFGMIVTRATIGLFFAREYTQEALTANREDSA